MLPRVQQNRGDAEAGLAYRDETPAFFAAVDSGAAPSAPPARAKRCQSARPAIAPNVNTPPDESTARQRGSLHVRLRRAGIAILIGGLVAAFLIHLSSGPPTGADAASGNSPLDDYNVERIGGKAAVYAARFNQWIGGLWHGRPLAYTVAAIAVAVALLCLWIADLASVPVADEPASRPGD